MKTIPRALGVALIVITAGSAAGAAPKSPTVDELVARARLEREEKRYDDVVRTLKQAVALQNAPHLIVALAQAYEDAKHYELAKSHYELCLGPLADQETKARARQGLERLAKVGERGVLAVLPTPPDATVTVDGEAWTVDDKGRSLTAGPHQVNVSKAGYITEAQVANVASGQTTRIVVPLREQPVVVPEPTPTHPEPPPETSAFGLWPWVAVGVGVVAVGVGAWSFADGTDDYDQVERAVRGEIQMSKAEADALNEDGETKRTVGAVAMGVGGALAVTGVVLLVLDGSRDAERAGWVPSAAGDATGWTLGLMRRF